MIRAGRLWAAVMAGTLIGSWAAAHAGEAVLGGQWWDQTVPEAKFQEFRVVPRGGFLESFWIDEWSGRHNWMLSGVNALRKDQATRFTYSNGARFRFDLGYQEIPHLFSQVAQSSFTQVRPGVFILPDTIQRVNQEIPGSTVNTLNDLFSTAPRLGLGFATRISKARAAARPARGWEFEVHAVERNRSGSKPWGASLGFNNAIELVEPIDQRMVDADIQGNFHRDRVTVQAIAGISAFDNRVGTLRWDNPKRLTDRTYPAAYAAGDGTSRGQLDLYPDNRAIRGSLALGLMLPRRTTFSATLGLAQQKQDDDWLPFTVNTAILQPDSFPLPARNSDAKANILTQNYRLDVHPLARVSGTLRFNGYKYDNKTPQRVFAGGYARLDEVWVPGAIETEAFGNEQKNFGADVDVNVTNQVSVGGTYEFRRRDHTQREVEQDDENVLAGRLWLHPTEDISLQARYRRGDRKLDKFLDEAYKENGVFVEQVGLRRFDVADRKQDQASGGLTWSPTERLDLSADYDYLLNDYDKSALGLGRDEQHNVAADATIHATDEFDINGGIGFGQIETKQRSRVSAATLAATPDSDWTARIKDRNTFVYVGAEWRPVPDRFSLAASYVHSRASGIFDLHNRFNTAQDLPATLYRRHEVLVETRYRVWTRTELAGRYGFEQYDVNDFASQGIPLLGVAPGVPPTAAAIYLGDNSQSYRAHRLALLVRRQF